jgi:uncharacterized protein YjbI with pentapeptide repeats
MKTPKQMTQRIGLHPTADHPSRLLHMSDHLPTLIRDLDGRVIFEGALLELGETSLSRADLKGANLEGAVLIGVDLRGADLRDSDLYWALLGLSDLRHADLRGACLRGAALDEADLSYAKLQGADLSDDNLGGKTLLRCANLRHAEFNAATRLPADFSPKEAGMVHADGS